MFGKKIFVLGVAMLLAGCEVTTPPITVNIPNQPNTGNNTSSLGCSLNLSQTAATSGQSIPVNVTVFGGSAPYTVTGNVGTFVSTVAISRTYSNQTNGNIVVADSVTVTDSIGSQASCTLSVTVVPAPSNALVCSASASTLTPAIGQTVNFSSSVSGGTAPYTYTSFLAGSGSLITANVSQISTTTATAAAQYFTSGSATATFQVRDATGAFAACSQNLTVASQVSVTLAAQPSTTVNVGNAITLTATPANFSSTPLYVFSTTTPGIVISSFGPFATITTTDSVTARSGVITVTATSGSQVATNTISVNFLANQTLTCNLNYTAGSYIVGQTVPFTITATNGQSLIVSELNVQDGYLLDSFLSTSPRISFYSSGFKTVSARARSASTGVQCNGGALVSTTISIGTATTTSPLACSLTLNPNPNYTWQVASATVAITGQTGSAWLTGITGAAGSGMYESGYRGTYTTSVVFPNSGSWAVTATVQDSQGRTASCSTTQVVYTDYLNCYWNGYQYVCY